MRGVFAPHPYGGTPHEDSMPEEAAVNDDLIEDPQGTPEVGSAPEAQVAEPVLPEAYTVKVGGEEVQVTLEEALKGYQRQADYTQKTQALAAEREQLSHADRLWNAIAEDPATTLRNMAVAYGIELTPAQQAAAPQPAPQAQVDEWAQAFGEAPQAPPQATPQPQPQQDDPRWQQVQAFMEAQQEQQMILQVQAEIAQVAQKYNVPNLDGEALAQYALDNGINNLDAAFRAMSFEAVQQAANRGRRQTAKADLPPVAGGHGVPTGAVVPGNGSQFPSIEEAAARAEAQLASQ